MQTVYMECAPGETNADMLPGDDDIVECSDDNPLQQGRCRCQKEG